MTHGFNADLDSLYPPISVVIEGKSFTAVPFTDAIAASLQQLDAEEEEQIAAIKAEAESGAEQGANPGEPKASAAPRIQAVRADSVNRQLAIIFGVEPEEFVNVDYRKKGGALKHWRECQSKELDQGDFAKNA